MKNLPVSLRLTCLCGVLGLMCACGCVAPNAGTTQAVTQRRAEPSMVPDDQIPDAEKYSGTIKTEAEAIPLSKVDVRTDRPLKALANVSINGQPKRVVIVLAGYGAFEWIRSAEAVERQTGTRLPPDVASKMPPPKDPVFEMTMPANGDWHIVKGILTGSQKQGSWVFVYPPTGAFIEEMALPLTHLAVTADGKLAAMKFSDAQRALVFYVPGRIQ